MQHLDKVRGLRLGRDFKIAFIRNLLTWQFNMSG